MLSSTLLNINVFPSSPSFIWYLFIRQFKPNWNGASISCLITAKCLFTDIRGANPTSHFRAICITAAVMASARLNGRQSAKTTAAFSPLLLHYAFLCVPWEIFSQITISSPIFMQTFEKYVSTKCECTVCSEALSDCNLITKKSI